MGAFATAGFPNAEMFAVLAKADERRIGDFNAQNLANTAWAFATAGFPHAELFAVLAKAAERRIGDFNAQGLADIAWAFATVGFPNAELFAVLAKAAERSHNVKDVKPTAWYPLVGRCLKLFFDLVSLNGLGTLRARLHTRE